jgi:amino acid adenylation domain-containing protein
LLKQLLERGTPAAPGAASNTVQDPGPVRRSSPAPEPSSAQERMWFLHQFAPESASYNFARAVELSGSVDAGVLEAVLQQLLARHEALRSTFPTAEGRPLLAFQPAPARVLGQEEPEAREDAGREAWLSRRLHEEATRPFDVERGPLYRFHLFRMAPGRHVFLLVLHHLVVDGWSYNVLMRELGALYGALSRQQAPQLAPLPLEYADFAAWQRTPATAAREAVHLEYWKRQLADAPHVLELPTDKPRPAIRTEQGVQSELLPLPSSLTEAVRTLGRERQVTPFMVFHAAFAALLHRYSQQTDFCVGTPVAGRTHLQLQGLVGLFINTVVLRSTVSPATPFSTLLARSRETLLASLAHQEAPFERVVEALQVERSLDRTPLVQVMFDLYQEERSLSDALAGLRAQPVHVDTGTSQFDLSLTVIESPSGFALTAQYSTDLFEAGTVQHMLGHYLRLLEHALRAPDTHVGALSLLSSEERQQVLSTFNATACPFDSEATLLSLFQAQAARTPDALAVVAPDGSFTFRQLAEHASRLALHLTAAGAGPESIVGMCLERSREAVVALLAIPMSGAACLPLEASHPPARRAALLRQAGACLVLSRPELFSGVELDMPLLSPHVREQPAPSVRLQQARAENLAYVLYTSGSTGEPKGAELTHRNIVHAFASFDALYQTAPGDCWIACGSFSFDMHLEEVLFSLTRGARTVLREVGPLGLVRDILQHGVTHAVLTPSALATAMEEPGALEAFRSMKMIALGGEAIPEPLVQQLGLTRPRLVNAYGPTETTICVVAGEVLPGQPVRLGRPLDRTQVYVLDEYGQLVPPGVPGELYIGGLGVGRSYRGKPHLTAERYVPDAFSGTPGARLYRTGDRVRWNADGTLSFLGRSDFQVKVRGVRIELEEVEAALLRLPGVRHAAALVRGSGREAQLEAFLVQEGKPALSVDALRQSLSRALPEAYVPSRFAFLPALPTTTSGKVDRKALAALPVEASGHSPGEAPRGPVEELLAQFFVQVLGVANVQRGDNFFHLGGHSLSAMRVVARVRQAFNIDLPLRTLFSAPSVARLALEVARLQGRSTSQLPAPTPLPHGAAPVLSSAQERMWLLHQLQPDSSAYHMPEAVELTGSLDSAALEQALRWLLARHPSLRLAVPAADGHPVPRLLPVPEQVLSRHSSPATSPEAIASWLDAEVHRPFDLAHGPLFRFQLWQLAPERHVLLLVFHHLLVDGLSLDILRRELGEAYAAFRQHQQPSLPPVALSGSDVAAWQRTVALQAHEDSQLSYWRQQLADAPRLLQLPTDKPRPAALSHEGAFLGFHPLPPSLHQALLSFCRQHHATPFMVLYAAFAALLHRYSGQEDFCVGTPASGRTHLSTEDVVGLLLNTVVLRTRLQPSNSFASLLDHVRASSLEALAHQDVPFERVVRALGVERSPSHSPLFQVMFDLARQPHSLAHSFRELHPRGLLPAAHSTPFELSFVVHESAEGYALSCRYSTRLFEAETLQRLFGHYLQLLEHALRAPDSRLDSLPLLTGTERHQLLVEWNATRADFPQDACLHTLVEAQARRTPEAPAVRAGEQTLSFRQLEHRANQLAHHLRRLGVGPEVRVALCLERSVDQLVALLGILKAGGAYVPMDASAPQARLAFMLRDCRAPVLVTRQHLADTLSASGVHPVCLDTHAELLAREDSSAPRPLSRPEHLAYVIYTSGSTGTPKGVMISHGSVMNLMAALDTAVPGGNTAPLRVSLNAPLTFDASVQQLVQLAHGHTLCIVPEEARRDARAMREFLTRHQVEVLDCAPSHLKLLLDEGLAEWPDIALRTVLVGGEALDVPTWAVLARHPRISFVNVYGPTECTVDSTACVASSKPAGPTIGRPLNNAQLYVLDSRLQPVPVGIPGELFIAGMGLARGYLERPDLTAERFIPHPFSSTPGERLYRTGDRVRYLPDGHLEYLDRVDFQVKVRGFRIELGEVEAALDRHPAVAEAAVVVREVLPGDKRLVAFVVPRAEAVPASVLQDWLRQSLPDYMVPSTILSLERMPLSRHGKLDRQALVALPMDLGSAPSTGEAPRGPVEELLAQLFAQVLGVPGVQREDDFFLLGGHSLSAMRVVARVRQAFNIDLPLATFFRAPTVAALAREVDPLQGGSASQLPAPTPLTHGAAPVLSSAQERMWLLYQLQPDSSAYHMPEAVELTGSLDSAALEQALRWLLARHPSLRLAVPAADGHPVPRLLPVPEQVVLKESLAGLTDATTLDGRLLQEANRPFDMAHGPLFRFRLWQLAPERHVLLLVFHHLLVDGLSLDILWRELGEAYAAFSRHRQPSLPAVALSGSDVAAWQRTAALQAHEDAQLSYWRQQLADAPQLLQFPTDKPRPAVLSHQGAFLGFHPLPPSLHQALLSFCRQHHATPFMVLYSAFAALLHRYCGQEDLCVGTPTSGRTHPSTEEVVGLLLNTVVLRTRLQPSDSFASLLEHVRTSSLEALAHQDAPFERVVSALGIERSASHSPLVQVVFNLARETHSLAHTFRELHPRSLLAATHSTPFELSFAVHESAEGYALSCRYSTDLFEAETLKRLFGHYLQLLEHALHAPDTHVGALSLLSSEERQQVLSTFNATARPFDSEATLLSLFQAQAARTPDALAVVAPDGSFTFRQLAEHASRLALHLAAAGAGPESIVGMCLERSREAVVALLAIPMSGAACLPLEAAHPPARRAALLRQAGACLVLSRPKLFSGVELDMPLLSPDVRELPAPSVRLQQARAENLAYVLYTSGSTGEPKGAELTHRNIVHAFASFDTLKETHPGDCWIACGSFSFDMHLDEVLFSLTRGARTVMREVGPLGLARDILQHGVTHAILTPSALATAMEEPGALEAFRSMKVIVLGGEVVPESLVQQLALTRTRLVNVYGPTETTICVVAGDLLPGQPVRLGRTLDRSQVYVLDTYGQLVPPGIPGELYIGGLGVGRSYRNKPHLTAERYVPDAISGVPGARLYRTGDRVRWNADGTLSFLGRSDFQVKVRGVRIELEEVEAALLRLPGVRHAAALVRGTGRDARLEAFLVQEGESALAVDALRQSLSRALPEAYVPSRFAFLPALPTTTSGKVDRKALAALPVEAAEHAPQGEAPRGPVEELLAQLFAQVLGVDSVQREDDFFLLGGHSLSAMRVVARVRQAFSVDLPLRTLFSAPSVARLALEVARLQERGASELPAPTPLPEGSSPVLSSAQERMWLMHQLQPDSSAYHTPEAVELTGALDTAALEEALRWLLERHPSLRLAIPAHEGSPAPVVRPVPGHVLQQESLAGLPDAVTLDERLLQEANRPFDMAHGPLFRFRLWQLAPERHVLLLVFHHLLVDGPSLEVLLRELGEAYAAFRQHQRPSLPPVLLDNSDVAAWQRSEPLQAREQAQLSYWQQHLADAPRLLQLPTDRPRPAVLSDKGATTPSVHLSPELSQALTALCQQHHVTPFMALFAAFSALLSRYSGQQDVCIGVPVTGRSHPATEQVVGLLVNTVPLRTRLQPADSFASLLAQVRTNALQAFAHQDVPLERVISALGIERSTAHAPLFQTAFVWNRIGQSLAETLPGLVSRDVPVSLSSSKLDLALVIGEGASLQLSCSFNSDLFEPETVQRLLGHYLLLLEQVLRAPDRHLGALSLLSSEERQQVVRSFNDTARPFDEQATFLSLFAAQVAHTPEATALLARDATLTYRQLDERSTALAHHLAALGAGPESVVGVCMERSSSLLLSLLAILKAGAAYLPLEPSHPLARRSALLRSAGARLLVTRPDFFPEPLPGLTLVSPEATGATTLPRAPEPLNLALVLFTSGSTGEPKAVSLSHRNLTHLFAARASSSPILPGDSVLASISLAFDVHVVELLYPLLHGARVLLRETGSLGMARDILQHHATHVIATPSVISAALEEPEGPEAFHLLRSLTLGGEAAPPSLLQHLASPSLRITNSYGPCETTCIAAEHPLRPGAPARLGRPFDRVRFYVLDAHGQPLPPGIPGELFIGGEGLSRGYHGRPDLTAERFVPDAFSGVPGARLYRTGDRVRWNADGTLSYLGRTDFQVKVRGVRIELEEVEAALLRLPGVRQAAALVRGSGREARLDAFLSFEGEATGTVESLRQALTRSLPEAMVPSRFVLLPALPLAATGKVDRKALAALPVETPEHAPQGEAPRGPVEELLAQLFAQVLGVDSVQREDDFFLLGGHSLSATRLVARVRQAFDVDLSLVTFFSAPTVAALAREVAQHQSHGDTRLPGPTPLPAGSPPLLSYAQERMWFMQQFQPDSSAYHMPNAVEVEGSLSIAALEQALQWLLTRHPVLRLALSAQDGHPQPRLLPLPGQVLQQESLAGLAEPSVHLTARLQQEVDRPFDMAHGPLFRFWLWQLAPERHVLLLVFHHLLVDGPSVEVLLRELSQAYAAFRQHQRPSLPPVLLDNSDVAAWQRSEPLQAREQAQLSYWQQHLADVPRLLQLPTDRPRPAVLSDKGATTPSVHLSPELSQALTALCQQHHVTPFMALFAAFSALLSRYSGQQDVCIGVPVTGRSHPATEQVVGLLVNTVPLRTRLQPADSFASLLAQVRTNALQAFAHQDVPLERIVSALGVERSTAHAPLFQTAFVWNRVSNSLSEALPGLASRDIPVSLSSSKLDLALVIGEGASLQLNCSFNSDLFEPETVQRLLGHYLLLLEQVLRAPSTHLGALSLLSSEERQQVVRSFNDTARPFDEHATFLSLFKAQAARTPEAPAVVARDATLTYRQLDERSTALAHHLAALGAGPESVVGVCLERSSSLLLSLLAILKAGAAYLPLEPSHPLARRSTLLRSAGARLLVTRPDFFPEPLPGLTLVAPEASGATAVPRTPEPLNLALVLFTSGSTGEPKAVSLSHRNLTHLFAARASSSPILPGDSVLASISLAFDVHVVELLYPLLHGARVLLRETGSLGMARDILQHHATHVIATPSVISAALEEPEGPEAFHLLRSLTLGGEAAPPSLLQHLASPSLRITNSYGPCETTCIAAEHPLRPGAPARLGRPFDRVRFYVLDAHGQPLPPGIPGELFIGGEGLSRGYHGRPDLTAERFVPDAFSGVPGARLYRTGDRVRWNADGTLSYLGRTDFQVKVRGVRIELEEVEAALLRLPGVRQAAALVRGSGRDARLDAFLSFEGETPQTGDTLRATLAASLPDAMVPSRLVLLPTLPLTTSGKVDRKALAALPAAASAAHPGEPPRGPVEELLAQLFARVLGVDSVQREDDFFQLGGHSLNATRLVAQVRQAFGVELPLTALFTSPTVAALATLLATTRTQADRLVASAQRPARIPASLVQERLWYALQLPGAPPYVIIHANLIEGALDADALEAALAAVVERHETLRSRFVMEGDTLTVQVTEPVRPVLVRTDLSHLTPEQVMAQSDSHATRHATQHFDVARGPLYRFELLRLDTSGRRHGLILSISHLVTDGLSMHVFLQEMETAYRAALAGEPFLLPPATWQYTDFALWQRRPEHLRQVEDSLESWKQALAHAPAVLDLPLDFPRRAPTLNANMRPVRMSLRASDISALKALARQEGVSTFTAVLALTQAWLHRLSAQSHVAVVSPFSGRVLPETERLVGYFTNLLPLCTDLSRGPSFRALLKRAHAVVTHATLHQEAPLKRIADAVHPDADRTTAPMAQVLLLLDTPAASDVPGLTVSDLQGQGVIPAYDLVVKLVEQPGGSLEARIATDSALFTEVTAQRMAHAFEHLLHAATQAPDMPLPQLSLLSSEQRAQVLAALDGGAQEVPSGACVHTLFEAQVLRTPQAPAVSHGSTTWSYAELNARANLLAMQLLATGLRPEERVGVVMEPTAHALAVLLGILKAGGAYVPLDPTWPEPRKRSALERAGVHRLWVDEAFLEEHQALTAFVEVPPEPAQVPGELGPGPRAASDAQLAYIIFTSGSTGEPKGVMVEHRSVVNHNLAIAARFGLRPGDRMLQFAPLSFDAAAEDLYPPLAVGATVVLRSGLLPAHTLTPYLEQEGITLISLPPTYIEEWVRAMEAQGQRVPTRLRLLAPGGDVLKRETYEAWVRVGGAHAPWLNVYGPTECTITSATCDIPGAEGVGTQATFPIGRPIPRVRFYLLDEHLQPVLPGLPGRVYIGGAALSRGYLGAPDLTAERFMPDPFAGVPGARMYHTGDLARLQPDGRLRFLGRADHQVKIRGFRIELSEIEACLRRFPQVEETVVLARTAATGLQQLCAWVQAPASVRPESLRAHVAEQLPAYMVPAAFVVLEKLPINTNGKVDRQALPDPDAAPPAAPAATSEDAAQPHTIRSTLELRMQRLWSEVLLKPDIQPEDDFFAIGGDSLIAMRLLGRMEEEFGLPMPLATLFQAPVLKDTVDALRELLEEGPPVSSVVRLSGPDVPASAPPIFFLHPGDGEVHGYRHLTPLLEPHFRCFGIQAPETVSRRTIATFEERLAIYVADVRAVQPHGPYRFVGFSYGGYPAYGVAAALEAAGEQVELLAMIDTVTTHAMTEVAPVQLPPELKMAQMFEVFDAELEQELAPLSRDERWERVAERARARGTVASHFTGKDIARTARMVGDVLPPQLPGWPVPSIQSRLLFFRASGTPSQDGSLGWSRYVPPERLDVVWLQAGHAGIMEPPAVSNLAARLLAALGLQPE